MKYCGFWQSLIDVSLSKIPLVIIDEFAVGFHLTIRWVPSGLKLSFGAVRRFDSTVYDFVRVWNVNCSFSLRASKSLFSIISMT